MGRTRAMVDFFAPVTGIELWPSFVTLRLLTFIPGATANAYWGSRGESLPTGVQLMGMAASVLATAVLCTAASTSAPDDTSDYMDNFLSPKAARGLRLAHKLASESQNRSMGKGEPEGADTSLDAYLDVLPALARSGVRRGWNGQVHDDNVRRVPPRVWMPTGCLKAIAAALLRLASRPWTRDKGQDSHSPGWESSNGLRQSYNPSVPFEETAIDALRASTRDVCTPISRVSRIGENKGGARRRLVGESLLPQLCITPQSLRSYDRKRGVAPQRTTRQSLRSHGVEESTRGKKNDILR